jgi:arylsulfatase A-like enzyme
MIFRLPALLGMACLAFGQTLSAQPNVILVFIDDIGWGDLSCYGSPVRDKEGKPITENLDRLAAEGIRFTDGYVAAPICSPSRVALLTGMHSSRHAIHSFLDSTTANTNRNMNDWLQPEATTSPRLFRDAGYATGMFGKWHMGGGRDVNAAPFPQDYGFEASLTSFEGMGDRILYNGHGLSNQNADVPGRITWVEWWQGAVHHTDAAIDFITASHAADKPFFVYVPHDDTHSPYHVEPGRENDFAHVTTDDQARRFLGELNALDRQIGRLVETVDSLGIAGETLIVVVGDNGAPNDNLNTLLNRNGGLRGGKGGLWEGGIREPFIIRMPGTVPAGVVNSTTAVSTIDLLPTFCALAGIALPDAPFEGENLLDVFKGSTRPRSRPLFWEYGTVSKIATNPPKLAVRSGNFKFMRNPDGSDRQFYNLATDRGESNNLAALPEHAATIAPMEAMVMRWYEEIVLGEIGGTYVKIPSQEPALLLADHYDLAGGSSAATGFGSGSGVNEALGERLTGTLAGSMSYVQTGTGKPASAHSIANNTLTVAKAANPTAFQFSNAGSGAFDFGPFLRGRHYEWRITLDLADPDPAAARMTLGIADSASPADGVGGHDLGIQLDLVPGNTMSVFKRIDAASHAGTGDINTAIHTNLPAGQPVDIRVVMHDSTDYSGFHTTYEIFVNGTSANSGNITFANDSRYIIFDTAPATGPARYDNFALETLDTGGVVLSRIPEVGISEFAPAAVSGMERVRLFWSTRPGQVVEPVISSDLATWTPLMEDGSPIQVSTRFGTIRWLEVKIPEAHRKNAFLRLDVAQ